MPLSKEHKAKTRENILNAAAHLFRRDGYDGVGVEAIMADVGLTRGGFYAHFGSKAELFSAVLNTKHDLIRRLQERDGEDPETLCATAAEVFNEYLSPANFERVAPSCTLSTLHMDAIRGTPATRSGYAAAVQRLHREIVRGLDGDKVEIVCGNAYNIASLALGALSLARSCEDDAVREKTLNSARSQIADWFARMGSR